MGGRGRGAAVVPACVSLLWVWVLLLGVGWAGGRCLERMGNVEEEDEEVVQSSLERPIVLEVR